LKKVKRVKRTEGKGPKEGARMNSGKNRRSNKNTKNVKRESDKSPKVKDREGGVGKEEFVKM